MILDWSIDELKALYNNSPELKKDIDEEFEKCVTDLMRNNMKPECSALTLWLDCFVNDCEIPPITDYDINDGVAVRKVAHNGK